MQKILFIEDSHSDLVLLQLNLSEQRMREAKFREATRLSQGLEMLKTHEDTTCVILDLNLPDSTGVDTYLRFRQEHPTLPVVVVTNDTDAELAEKLFALGARQFVVKDFKDPLPLWFQIQQAIEESVSKK